MNEFSYADRYLNDYKVRGYEIVATCPICNGGRHKDKDTFYLNVEKHTYVCHRGSCGAKGTFNDLTVQKGETADYMEQYKKSFEVVHKKTYTKPKMELNGISEDAKTYLNLRCISDQTIKDFAIKSDKNGNIVFAYFNENNEHDLSKFRLPRKFIKGTDKTKTWQEGGGRPILYNMNRCTHREPLVITEGEIDCLSVYESGFKNVVSVPFGTENLDWILECWDWLDGFNDLLLWFDNDKAGIKARNEVVQRLGKHRCRIINCDYKDANLALYSLNKDYIISCIENAEIIPIDNLVRLADVEEDERDGMLYGIKFLDYWLGGCIYGDLAIWTGKRGGAKSTILQQTIPEAIEAGNKVFIYSAELNNAKARRWLERQMVRNVDLVKFTNKLTGREDIGVRPEVSKVLRGWYKDCLYSYGDKGGNTEDELFEIMEYAYRRHGIKRFILDNLKTIRFKSGANKFDSQGAFVQRCKDFCNQYKCHIDLVAHPKKTGDKEEMEDEDVGGSSDIIDLADIVIECKKIRCDKLPDGKCQQLNPDAMLILSDEDKPYMNRLRILKNREYGDTGITAFYNFNKDNKRIEGVSGWDKEYSYMSNISHDLTIEELEDMPF